MLKIHHLQKQSQVYIRQEEHFPKKGLQAVKFIYKTVSQSHPFEEMLTPAVGQCPSP